MGAGGRDIMGKKAIQQMGKTFAKIYTGKVHPAFVELALRFGVAGVQRGAGCRCAWNGASGRGEDGRRGKR